jgi:L-amino acid N-acyltransferase YncA
MAYLEIRPATERDVPVILELIQALAEYEKLTHTCVATEARLRETFFGKHPAAQVLLAHSDGECGGYAVFFMTYSTFLAAPGLYLEDLYVRPHLRGKGIGLALAEARRKYCSRARVREDGMGRT